MWLRGLHAECTYLFSVTPRRRMVTWHMFAHRKSPLAFLESQDENFTRYPALLSLSIPPPQKGRFLNLCIAATTRIVFLSSPGHCTGFLLFWPVLVSWTIVFKNHEKSQKDIFAVLSPLKWPNTLLFPCRCAKNNLCFKNTFPAVTSYPRVEAHSIQTVSIGGGAPVILTS